MSVWKRLWLWIREIFMDQAQDPGTPEHIRGPQRVSFEEAKREASRNVLSGQRTFRWGLCDLPYDAVRRGLRLIGAQGSGKTVLIRMLLRNGVLNHIGAGGNVRAYIFDAKNDYIRDLSQLGLPDSVERFHVHPFAPTGCAWDIGKDLTDDVALETFSHLLFPESQSPTGNQHFFERAQRLILQAVLISLRRLRGTEWTLRDAILAILDHDDLVRIVRATEHPINNTVLKDYFPKENPELATNIRAGLLGAASEFMTVAARWHWAARDPKRRFTLTQWMSKPSVIVFGYEHASGAALKGLNRALFGRMTQLLLGEGHDPDRTTWVLLDELATPGKLTGIKELFAVGRDRGIAILLGFQETSHLDEIYTQGGTHSVISLCQLHGALHIGSYETRKWAEEQFGYREVREVSAETGEPKGRTQEALVHEGEIVKLPFPSRATGLGVHAFFVTLSKNAYKVSTTWKQMVDAVPPLIEGPLERETVDGINLDLLPPWTDEERRQLGLAPRERPPRNASGEDDNVF